MRRSTKRAVRRSATLMFGMAVAGAAIGWKVGDNWPRNRSYPSYPTH